MGNDFPIIPSTFQHKETQMQDTRRPSTSFLNRKHARPVIARRRNHRGIPTSSFDERFSSLASQNSTNTDHTNLPPAYRSFFPSIGGSDKHNHNNNDDVLPCNQNAGNPYRLPILGSGSAAGSSSSALPTVRSPAPIPGDRRRFFLVKAAASPFGRAVRLCP
jgi:hypothetical protein